jgi:hypothetical protein
MNFENVANVFNEIAELPVQAQLCGLVGSLGLATCFFMIYWSTWTLGNKGNEWNKNLDTPPNEPWLAWTSPSTSTKTRSAKWRKNGNTMPSSNEPGFNNSIAARVKQGRRSRLNMQ